MFGSLFSENAQHKFGLKTEFGSKQSIMHLKVGLQSGFKEFATVKKTDKAQAPYCEQKINEQTS